MQYEDDIFKRGSKTYYAAAKLFPAEVRADVAKLYSFVRVADDYVDAIPQQSQAFMELKQAWNARDYSMRVVKNMDEVARKYQFKDEWVDAFLRSMEFDLSPTPMKDKESLQTYIYGSAEVIGLMMARILQLPGAADEAARAQGSAMQLINFIRDIREDISFGRQYLPLNDMYDAGLASLDEQTAKEQPEAFTRYIHGQLKRYKEFQAIAEQGMYHIPTRYRRAIQVANDGYAWTARAIARRPLRVFEGSLKPPKWYLLWRALVRGVSS